MAWDFNVKGDEGLRKMLQSLTPKLARKALRPALRAGAKKVMNAAKARAPFLTGALAKGDWKVRAGKSSRKVAKVKMRVLLPTRESLGIPADAKHYYPAVLEYGGKTQDPHPFLRPATNESTAAVVSEVRTAIRNNIERIAHEAMLGGE
jgi:HK97 gp10 family phage protein